MVFFICTNVTTSDDLGCKMLLGYQSAISFSDLLSAVFMGIFALAYHSRKKTLVNAIQMSGR